MTLEFPNRSRSFDDVRNAVRFIGHDGMFEVPFFVEAAALTLPGNGSIHDVAREAYSYGRRTSYTLTEADFR
ncbi:DUF1488 family protein [Mesorhizobium xinjiangense]|uniref:DUF1488 family protein n=1 Tax=Mesorhizobium xinjiangense TaxID=2678685 RepID=UPI0012EDB6EA|nr:DUF1488 family protein [Mesorhizobium xinjiangense]